MRELSILTFLTLDGVMQAPALPEEDTSGGFMHGGWAANYWPEVMEQVEQEAMAQPFDLLFGRRTYDLFAGHWPNAPESAHGQKLNAATKYVATSSLTKLEWQNSVPITGDVAAKIAKIKESDGPLLQVHGSSQLIQTLLANNLIDEFRMWTFPVVLGSGKRLFSQGTVPAGLTLLKTDTTSNGVVMGIYRRIA
jgi:dihydrofolate reductase